VGKKNPMLEDFNQFQCMDVALHTLRTEMMPRTSEARSIKSYSREIRLERCKAFEIVGRREQIDVWECRPHATRLRAVVVPAEHRIKPDDAPAAATQTPHFLTQLLGRAGVVTIGDDHHRRPRIEYASRVPPIESSKALSDLCAAADTLCHQR